MAAPDDSKDAFFARAKSEQRTYQTSAGPCELPILYSEAGLVGLFYRVDAERARAMIEPDFEPWVIFGKAVAALYFFDYRTTTIGPYGEVGLGFLVKRKGTRPSLLGAAIDLRKEMDAALYVVNLPVTTEAARSAGKELWGYPKYVTPMESTWEKDGVRFKLGSELELTMGPCKGISTEGLPIVLFSTNNGRVLRTVVDVDNTQTWGGSGSVKLTVTGDAPTSRTVKTLGMDAMKPMLAFRTDGLRSILPIGDDMGASVTAPAKRHEVETKPGVEVRP